MTATTQYDQTPTFSQFLDAATDALHELTAGGDEEPFPAVLGPVLHVCEPDYQLLAELSCPCQGMHLVLVLDLDPDAVVTAAEITDNDAQRHALRVELDTAVLQRIADEHFHRHH